MNVLFHDASFHAFLTTATPERLSARGGRSKLYEFRWLLAQRAPFGKVGAA